MGRAACTWSLELTPRSDVGQLARESLALTHECREFILYGRNEE
jgi:hypothetical protein